jgi:hypothetical protein
MTAVEGSFITFDERELHGCLSCEVELGPALTLHLPHLAPQAVRLMGVRGQIRSIKERVPREN